MSRIEGRLRKQPSGRWVICRRGRDPSEITSGDGQVAGKVALQPTQIEFVPRGRFDGECVSKDDYPLRNWPRAAVGAD